MLIGLQSQEDGFFSQQQIQAQDYKSGTSFAVHGGMISDFLLFALLMAIIAGHHASWALYQVAICGFLSAIVSSFLHKSYETGGIRVPNWAAHDGILTEAAITHWIYATVGITLILLYYFCTPHLGAAEVYFMTLMLVVHVIFGVIQPAIVAGDDVFGKNIFPTVLAAFVLLSAACWFTVHYHTI